MNKICVGSRHIVNKERTTGFGRYHAIDNSLFGRSKG